MTPVVYVTDSGPFAPEDALDLRYLKASENHALLAVVAGEPSALVVALDASPEPVNLVAVGGYGAVRAVWEADPSRFRERVARVFLVGGALAPFVPIDPRLAERHPERFPPNGDPRVSDWEAFTALLQSGEAVIWLPRDICLWRVDVMGLTESPVLLSAIPAFYLARRPDPILWLRLFRTIPARVDLNESGEVTLFDPKAVKPNLYAVVALDGAALTREFLRVVRPE